ncbi:uncharacterized protein LOC117229628 [Megalopta genalis]|uniref:uncharacterized protein LOC117229628 n=1 Tax=Megalopta genalis TaxID=115081 RepID=UPI003FD191C0
MDPEIKSQKSLPPLVEGKIHGYLKLVIDEVVWSHKSFGDIKIFASWWGETGNAQFRPVDVAKNIIRSTYEITEVYAVRTNINLFQEYVENCECIELTIVSEENNIVIGTSKITDLLKVFELKPYVKYVPIINESESKIGEIHVFMKLEYATKFSNMHLKPNKYIKEDGIDNTMLVTANSFKYPEKVTSNNVQNKLKAKDEIYKSILKSRRTKFQKTSARGNEEVMDELVTQIVARAQRLRGEVLRESHGEDVFDFSDNSLSGTLQSHVSTDDNIKFWKYHPGKETTSPNEHKVLSVVGSSFPTASSIDFTSDNFDICEHSKKKISPCSTSFAQTNSSSEKIHIKPKETLLLDQVNSIRIFVESFTQTPAGYRRVKSSSLSHHDNTFVHPTYFVQYDMSFEHIKLTKKRSANNNNSVRILSKKQTGKEIYFNHDGIYEISELKSDTEYFVKFKIFVRHFNKKSIIELGVGTMHVNDIIKTKNWSSTQRIIILNKGIKIGELSVIAELGSDFIHFGKQYIDDIISSKENIPSLRMLQQLSKDKSKKRNKNATDIRSETHSEVPSISTQVNRITTINNLLATTNVPRYETESSDAGKITLKDRKNDIDEKDQLRGFIYIAEGKELSELNTYLICRAFWTKDKSRSRICSSTKNPFYRFSQIVPVICDADLLNLMKDNYIIIEIYYRNNNNIDNLLGLTKLPIHSLYVAYRDPHVLPHLLSSKYPVVSVDEWVPIIDPITGQSHGQLLALVALGTTEQIALLETSRSLQNTCKALNTSENLPKFIDHPETVSQSNRHAVCVSDPVEKKLCSLDVKTQECQTDISTIKELKLRKISQEETNSEDLILHNLVDRLTEVLNIDKADSNNDISLKGKKQIPINAKEHICISDLNLHSGYHESDSSSVRQNYHLPTETYRSVGVGAEYEEEIDQQSNTDYTSKVFDLQSIIHREEEEDSMGSECNETMFRAVVEIECALHLPKLQKINETIDPSTYVSFQANKCDPSKHLNSCMITNVFPHSCNPKWNWKSDVKLPIELLLCAEKRLILKVWRILDSDTSTEINLERDVVIGFSAVDVSVLISGFPIISGWFHIMDFSGECKGQIKVSIAPLDNLSLFKKSTSLSTTRIPMYDTSQFNWLPLNAPDVYTSNAMKNDTVSTLVQVETPEHTKNQLIDSISHVGLEDTSMSFLSLSLKKKLTELDEITQRLELRLRDVTNAAFEDYIDNEFDLNDSNSDVENNDYKSANAVTLVANATSDNNRVRQILEPNKKSLQIMDIPVSDNQIASCESEIRDYTSEPFININETKRYMNMKSGSSYVANSYDKQNVMNCQVQHGNEEFVMQNIRTLGKNTSDYPERGTKTHINYLLDKLSLQFPLQSHSSLIAPIINNTDLLTNSIQNSNSNLMQNNNMNTCTQEFNACAILKDAGDTNEQDIEASVGDTVNCSTNETTHLCETCVSSQSQIINKMSTVIREELTSEENNDASKCDGLTTYLIASNIRHMDSNVFDPLLYQHLVPDLYYSNTSPEEDAIEQLDNHYTKDFVAITTSNQLGNVENLRGVSSSADAELFRTVQSGLSENIDNNTNLTVLHKVSCNDLLISNSTESTTTISPEQTSVKHIDLETTEHSYSTSSQASDLILSRQAPDGGNPMEDITKQSILQQTDDNQDSSPNSCN